MLRPHSVTPATLGIVLIGAALIILPASLVAVDRAGEAIIAAHQRLVAETARDDFVAFANEAGLAPLARALDRHAGTDSGAFRYAVFDSTGTLLGGADLLPSAQLPGLGFSTLSIPASGQTQQYEVLVQPVPAGGTLVIYENLSEREELRRAILGSLEIALIASIGIIAAISFWFGRVLVNRAAGIAAAAQRISRGDLSARAPVGTSGDVFDELGRSVNAMLDRIDSLFTGLQTVTDSLAHDLRSPLARMRSTLTHALGSNIAAEERLVLIEEAQRDCEQILAIFSALLDIARAETGVSLEMMAPVDLTLTVTTLAELFAPVLEDAGQTLNVAAPAGPLTANVHDLLLRVALGNLLHNAARHAGSGAHVLFALEHDASLVYLIVADNGPGIPAADRGRVQERFIRLDSSRGTPGSGLGLAIAAACAKLHGGSLTLEDNRPGLRAVLALPRFDDPAPTP